MRFSQFFISRPIFATVLSLLLVIVGGLSYTALPVTQYPDISPPVVSVRASYPGANADTVAQAVATPIEEAISGVENMLYMTSQSTGDGNLTISVTFDLGTDLNDAQVQVQNRVSRVVPRLPEQVRQLGVTTSKNSPNFMMAVNILSPQGSYDTTYMANYGRLNLLDAVRRIQGVGDVQIFGGSDYAMRVWLDADALAAANISPAEVLAALRAQNVQVASGSLNTLPSTEQSAFEMNVETQGRLSRPEEFENLIIKSSNGRLVYLRDVARVELAAQQYATMAYLGDQPSVILGIFQQSGGNALQTATDIKAAMEKAKQSFPDDLDYKIIYNTTDYIDKSIAEVFNTLLQAILLVAFVMILFLQSWRAAIIPIVAIPVALIATFFVMQLAGFSINTLSLFGLVLAIGIVVDDVIVVVENMERYLDEGYVPHKAAVKTMNEVGGALIATSLVVVAAFLPSFFIEGLAGQFYKQFGLTIATATLFSTLVSLTLSPAMAVVLLRPRADMPGHCQPPELWPNPLHWFFYRFNAFFDALSGRYAQLVKRVVRMGAIASVIYIGLIAITGWQFQRTPTGYIPQQDQGYLITIIQLPSGASLSRTDKVTQQVASILTSIDGIENAVAFAGFAGATGTNASNAAAIFPVLDDFDVRSATGRTVEAILGEAYAKLAQIQDAFVIVVPPPAVPGLSSTGGFRMMLQDRASVGSQALEAAAWQMAGAAHQDPAVTGVFTLFETSTPRVHLDIDQEKAQRLGINPREISQTLEVLLGSSFVNDFNFLGRTFQVIAQAEQSQRDDPEDILNIRVRNGEGQMVPVSSFASIANSSGPSRIARYNLYPAAALMGDASPGYSSGEAVAAMEKLAAKVLPPGVGYEWTESTYLQQRADGSQMLIFAMAVLFVFMILAAQYESWTLPLAIVLIVPMCLLSAILGITVAGMDNNILTQIGFVVLIGLAAKNAILIVEFAKQEEEQGKDRWEAAVTACYLRLRPILMTSLSFVFGVLPLVFATGAGAEMRQAIGVAVFSGMIGVTVFGLFFTPVFYVLCRGLGDFFQRKSLVDQGEQ